MASSGSRVVHATYTSGGSVGDALEFIWSQSSQSVSGNYTVITWQLRLHSYGAGLISSSASKSWSVTVNGSKYSGTNTVGIGNNSVKTLASGSTTIPHNADGTKTFSYSFSQVFNITFNSYVGTISGSSTGILNSIPRYASITTFRTQSFDQTSVTYSWTTNAVCDWVQYRIGSGSWVTASTASAASGTVTIGNLAPGNTYSIKLAVKRKDSQLVTESGTATVTTIPIASLTNQCDFTIGSNLNLSIANSGNNPSTIYLYVENNSGVYEKVAAADITVAQAEASYTWNLSEIADVLYSKCTTKNKMNIKVYCGVTLNSKRYENIYTGVASVTGSNPVFTTYSYGNSDTAANKILGNTSYMIQNYGNMQVRIAAVNRATAKNGAAILNYAATVTNSSEVVTLTQEAAYSANDEITIDFGKLANPGSYSINIYALDSRGNRSAVIRKAFYVLPYHNPTSVISLNRANGFEKEVTLDFTAYYSRLLIGSTVKNSSFTVKYRYREAGSPDWIEYTTLSGFSSSVYSTDDMKVTLRKTASTPFLELDIENSYEFEFVLTDKRGSVINTVSLPQGIPIMLESDNGFVGIGKIPNWNTAAKLQVGSDILATDADGAERLLVKELDDMYPGGTNILRNTNTNIILTTAGNWDSGAWQSASSNTGSCTKVSITDAPNPDIKYGWAFQSADTGTTNIFQNQVPLRIGSTYTLSCYARAKMGTPQLCLQYGSSTDKSISIKVANTTWKKFSFTFLTEDSYGLTTNEFVDLNFGTNTAVGLEICGEKLELGNKATDWCPSPWDTDNRLITLENIAYESGSSTNRSYNTYADGRLEVWGNGRTTAAAAAWNPISTSGIYYVAVTGIGYNTPKPFTKIDIINININSVNRVYWTGAINKSNLAYFNFELMTYVAQNNTFEWSFEAKGRWK